MKRDLFIYTTFSLLVVLILFMFGCKNDENGGSINLGLFKVEANPDKGFYWPYYLNVPNSARSTTLLVQPNSSPSCDDNPAVHDEVARELAEWRVNYAQALHSPLLVPAYSRPCTGWPGYTHALDRTALETSISNYQRLDLQLIAMIDDARERLSGMGIDVDYRVFIMGGSAAGMFANRFTALHPERVKAAAIGAPGGWPLAPVEVWQGEALPYHVGVADLDRLVGRPFDLGLFRTVPLFFYMGDQDTNDAHRRGWVGELIFRLFGATPVERWPKVREIYESVGCTSQFVLYPGVGHTITSEMESDVIQFFLSNG